jgi:aldose 1-epimerase
MTDVIHLRDAASGSTAAILPSYGFNCYSFQAVIDGQATEALWAEPGFALGSNAMGNGIPLLFPFVGRLSSQEQTFQGKTFQIRDAPVLDGKSLHGYVIDRPWRVVEQTENRAAGTFRAAIDAPALVEQWPADFEITVSYEVAGTALISEITIANPDIRPLPFAFGTHTYFRLPVGGGDASACRITVPAGAYWELEGGIPTGPKPPAVGPYGLRDGLAFGDLAIDAVFADLAVEDGEIQTTIEDPNSGRRVTQRSDPIFRECVIYCPPHREAIAIEPWTGIPDPFALSEQGFDTGLQVLAPGESRAMRIEIGVE